MDRYLSPADYSIQIRSEIKTLLSGASDRKMIIAETAAVNEMKSYLKRRYDVDNIFFLLKGEYDNATPYIIDNRVYYKPDPIDPDEDYQVYVNIQDGTGQAPTVPVYWSLDTARNPFVILKLVDIVLYHLHSKEAARAMPKIREDRYQDALDWLKMVGKGTIDADLPLLPDESDTNQEIRFGSKTLEDNDF